MLVQVSLKEQGSEYPECTIDVEVEDGALLISSLCDWDRITTQDLRDIADAIDSMKG